MNTAELMDHMDDLALRSDLEPAAAARLLEELRPLLDLWASGDLASEYGGLDWRTASRFAKAVDWVVMNSRAGETPKA